MMLSSKSDQVKSPVESYEKRYSDGGWTYNYNRERTKLERIVNAVGLTPGASILEIGCGEGFHSSILYDMGFRVVANDLSKVAIKNAESRIATVRFLQCDSLELCTVLPQRHFDMILARGHSWYHYELTENNSKGWNVPEYTRRLLTLVRLGGVFALCIRTDFSGTYYKDGVVNNTYDSYKKLFERFGEIVYLSDEEGTPLRNDDDARSSGRNIVIAARIAA